MVLQAGPAERRKNPERHGVRTTEEKFEGEEQ